MRITHAITKGDVGGAQTHVVELALAQRDAGDEVTVLAGTDGQALDRLRRGGASVAVLPELGRARSSVRLRSAYIALRTAILESHPDVVHGHSSTAGLLARIAARRHGLVSVYTAHGWPFQSGARVHQRLMSGAGELMGGRLGDGVICLTAAEAELARRWRVARADATWVIANGLADVSTVRPPGGVGGPLQIAMVARFAAPKLQSEVIDVLATLSSNDWRMSFVGSGPALAECQERSRMALGDHVTFLGERDDVHKLLASVDVLVLWSRYEGMPISLLEGMRAGVCCVASDLPGVRELFGDPSVGVVAAETDELRRALDHLITNRASCDEWGRLARGRFEAEFEVTAMAMRTRLVYVELLKRRCRL